MGFFTAIETIADSVAQIRDTMESHNRAVIIEAMGRNKGDLSFFASKLVECDIVSTPEDPMTEEEVLNSIVKLRSEGKRSIVALVTENMYDIQALAEKITNTTEVETRGVILGHAQRGGKANNIDYEIATDMSYKAIETLEEGKSGVSIGLVNNELIVTPIKEALDTKSTKTQSELLNDFNNRE
ncbi:MAG: hypothetical protein DRP42_03360 [Tenericutes bacterium]|nr:MAG: hypothetical protein DRP42_03360 [Mycoplasmatota bacterium]